MASEMPPADAEQPKSLLAQYHKRLMWRLAAWGGAAAISLVAAVIVSQTGAGNKRLQLAMSEPAQPDDSAVPLITGSVPESSADVAAVRRMTNLTARKLAAVERNTAATRAETKRLALQLNKLTADSFRFTGRLANIEHQIDGIAGSIKQQAQDAAAAAVAKAMPPKAAGDRPGSDSIFDKAVDATAPVISPPATLYPKLSLIMPPAPGSPLPRMTKDGADAAHATAQDVTITSAITKPKDQARVEPKPMAKAPAGEMQAEVDAGPKAMAPAKGQIAGAAGPTMAEPKSKPRAKPKSEAKSESKQPAHAMKMASASPPTKRLHVTVRPGRYSRSLLPTRGYGVDLGGADSITVVKAQWAAVKANFGPMLRGLRPTAVRDHRILSGGSYRLVIGRLHSRKAADRLCSRLASQQVSCQPVKFDDGRVVWR